MAAPLTETRGLLDLPENCSTASHSYSLSLRVTAIIVIGSFIVVSIVASAYSLGTYCLTIGGRNPFT